MSVNINIPDAANKSTQQEKSPSITVPSPGSFRRPQSPAEPVPGTSKEQQACRQTPKHSRTRLNISIEIPSPSQVGAARVSLIDRTRIEQ